MPHADETHDLPDPRSGSHLGQADRTHPHASPEPTASRSGDPTGTVGQSAEEAAASAAGSGPPDALPGYEILGKVGEGAMGGVYRARQLGLNREVAVKRVLAGVPPATLARFAAEAQAMAAVRHPHVVQVFELGEHAGRPFIAMEYVPGGSLADRLKAADPLPPREAAGLVEKIARGVAAAHDLGIVHRDLKPGNVLLAADGAPKVADFGIAKWRDVERTATAHVLLGTPAYMAPEQAAGRAKFVGPAADVWALGVILYECVAGRRPFAGDSVEVLLSQIRTAAPAALRGLPRDLDTVVGKCLAKEPERRYPTAAELADDLGRFVRGEPVAARRAGPAERVARWARRNPTAAAAYGLSALAGLLALVVVVVVGLWRDAEGARVEATDARGRVEDLLRHERELQADLQAANGKLGTALRREQDALENLARFEYGRTVQVAHQEARDNAAVALALLESTRPDLRGWEWRYVHRLCHGQRLTLKGHDGWVQSAAWSPDGAKVATAGGDHTARVWDARSGAELLVLKGHSGDVHSAGWGPDGTKVVTAGLDQTARVWDAATGKELLVLEGHKGWVNGAAFGPDGAKVATASDDRTARVWDAATGNLVVALKGHAGGVHAASWSPDGAKVVTASEDGTARVWDAATGKELLAVRHDRPVRSAAWSPDGAKLVTGSDDRTARVWDARSGAELLVLKGHTGDVNLAAWGPDGARVVTASEDGTARVWDAATGAEVRVLRGHVRRVRSAAFSPDGARVVTASEDGTARVWDAGGAADPPTFKGHASGVDCAAWSPDGSKVATASEDHIARIWDAATGNPLLVLEGHTSRVNTVAWSPDGSKVVTASVDGTARVWDARTGRGVLTLAGHTATV
ncbi:MAG: serine/threonine protein kinase, partial [Isosphaera sp.]|nr:serine/threonine protein kinase [Isosphaera sp.]